LGSVAAIASPACFARGQQPAPDQHQEQHAGGQRSASHRQKVEQRETVRSLLRQGGRHQQVGRCADLGGETAQKAAEGQGHEQPRRRHAGLTRQPHHHRQHQHCHADVVHESGQSARGEHDHGHQRGLVAAGQAQHVSPDQVAHAGSEQPLADDEHGPERNHGLVAEAGHRLGGRDQPGDGERAHHQQGDDVHA